jgi:hypothetical protein
MWGFWDDLKIFLFIVLLMFLIPIVGGAGFSVANHLFRDAMSSCEVRE